MKLRDYSFAGGGKPEICGDGNLLIFRIDNDNIAGMNRNNDDNMSYYFVISQYEQIDSEPVGMRV